MAGPGCGASGRLSGEELARHGGSASLYRSAITLSELIACECKVRAAILSGAMIA